MFLLDTFDMFPVALHPRNIMKTVAIASTENTEEKNKDKNVFESHHAKVCLRDFRPGKIQTSVLSYRNKLHH